METSPSPLLVTGANGHLGLSLARSIARPGAIRAVVRSARAAATLEELPPEQRPEIHQADPTDPDALVPLAQGASAWIHLVGILKESSQARYEDAHEGSVRVVREAAERAGVSRIVYLSILGSHPEAENACLRSKGRAEAILREGKVPTTVLRVPMVLGPGELAAFALRGQASAPLTFLVRGGATREQPIDHDDVVAAVRSAAADTGPDHHGLDLSGPESLSHRELVLRVAERLGTKPRIVPLPRGLVFGLAGLLERLQNPPVTRAMLGVLEHDDDIDPGPACKALGIELTPLDDTLDRTFARQGAPA
ncbi:MAG: NAD(P)H-binding protein [Myxococcota bacterium]|nr:NAD(P)H-binding protein [Myxococcota bacterium]